MKDNLEKGKWVKNILRIILILILVSIFSLTIISCKRIVIGSGNVISEDRDVSGFNKVSVSGSGNIYIEQGDMESLTIEAEDNIISLIEAKVSGNTLKIGLKTGASISFTKDIKYHLKVKELESILGSGSGGIYCEALETDSLLIKTSGSRKVEISNLKTKNINIDSSGSGDITLSGSTNSQKIETSGSVKYFGEELISRICVIDSSGSGDLVVNVSDSLDINASGSVKITYIGSPDINQRISGTASINSK